MPPLPPKAHTLKQELWSVNRRAEGGWGMGEGDVLALPRGMRLHSGGCACAPGGMRLRSQGGCACAPRVDEVGVEAGMAVVP